MPPKTVTRRRILTRRHISRPPETSLRNLIGQPSQQRNYEPTLVSRPEPPAVSQAQHSEAPHPAMMGFDGHIDGRRIPDAGVPTEIITGVLDIIPEGHGVIRPKFPPSDLDAYISSSQIRRFYLRRGDIITGPARRPKENERYWGLLRVDKVFDQLPEIAVKRVKFESLTPIFPDRLMKLETDPEVYSTRLIDIVAPVGFGQRGLIVSPPKAGKTTILKDIATGIAKNHPDVHLMAVLVGERPEEVTDIRRHIEKVTNGKGEVAASNFDEPPEEQ